MQKNAIPFQAPVEALVTTIEGDAHRTTVWLDRDKAAFEVKTVTRPVALVVDPDYDLPSLRMLPLQLSQLQNDEPNHVVIYGTAAETDANRTAARRFNEEFLFDGQVVMADTDVGEKDLRKRYVVLFGRPATNRISQRLRNLFLIPIRGQSLAWQGTTYNQPTQAVVEVTESPFNAGGLIILYAGLSGASTLRIVDLSFYAPLVPASYVIIQGNKELARGDWKIADGLRWKSGPKSPHD